MWDAVIVVCLTDGEVRRRIAVPGRGVSRPAEQLVVMTVFAVLDTEVEVDVLLESWEVVGVTWLVENAGDII
ncbi:hypothetical protein [Rhodococcus sp. A14]|uniref:hypothetical protein n=1 Tax=Rhodococcus sp. A14 TaxID=1194106 RepID=UPI001420BD8F|nr:hypothetical protein [Rhodococcus sp. A14]